MGKEVKWLVGFLSLLFFSAITLYFRQLDESIASVRATRPVLIFTLIVAMLGFGGMMMAKSLFGKEDLSDFSVRFRHAREIFLVYAGIFGTIIGFYFGAADEGDISAAPSATVAVRNRTVSVQISGGTAPFFGYLEQGDPKADAVLAKSGERLLTVELASNSPCPDQSTITILDGRGRKGTASIGPKDIVGWGGTCGTSDSVSQPAGSQEPAKPAASPTRDPRIGTDKST